MRLERVRSITRALMKACAQKIDSFFQHAVFGVCRLIDLVVPDIPESLDVKIKRERYLAKEALQDADHVLQVKFFGCLESIETCSIEEASKHTLLSQSAFLQEAKNLSAFLKVALQLLSQAKSPKGNFFFKENILC